MKRTFDFLRLIDLIDEAATDARNWANAVIAIAAALGAPAISLSIADAEAKESPFLVAPRDDSERIRRIFDRWAVSNLVREPGLGSAGGIPYRFAELSADPGFDTVASYCGFRASQRQEFVLFVNLGDERGIGFHRSLQDTPFEAEDKRLLTGLTPHLQRAVALNRRLRDLETERDGVTALLDRFGYGALLVDAEAHILFANAAAQSLLRERAGLCAREGRLAACRPAKTAALRRLIAGEGEISGRLLAVPCRDGWNLPVLVLPLRAETIWASKRPAAIVLVKDPEASAPPSREELRELFGLTPAQAALAREMLAGDGVQAVAERLGISRSTARTHLLEVFQRTGTSRQAELVRVIFDHSLTARIASE